MRREENAACSELGIGSGHSDSLMEAGQGDPQDYADGRD